MLCFKVFNFDLNQRYEESLRLTFRCKKLSVDYFGNIEIVIVFSSWFMFYVISFTLFSFCHVLTDQCCYEEDRKTMNRFLQATETNILESLQVPSLTF